MSEEYNFNNDDNNNSINNNKRLEKLDSEATEGIYSFCQKNHDSHILQTS
jgi:hypothetical protein